MTTDDEDEDDYEYHRRLKLGGKPKASRKASKSWTLMAMKRPDDEEGPPSVKVRASPLYIRIDCL
jgi:hypothetical protein